MFSKKNLFFVNCEADEKFRGSAYTFIFSVVAGIYRTCICVFKNFYNQGIGFIFFILVSENSRYNCKLSRVHSLQIINIAIRDILCYLPVYDLGTLAVISL